MALSKVPREIILDIADELDDPGISALESYSHHRLVVYTTCRIGFIVGAVDVGRSLNPIPESIHMALQDSANRVRFVEQLLKIDGINPNFQPFLSLPEAAIVEWLLAVVSIDLRYDAIDAIDAVDATDTADAIDATDTANATDATAHWCHATDPPSQERT